MAVEVGHQKEKDIEFGLGKSQLGESTAAHASVDSEVHGNAGITGSFPTVEKFEQTSLDTKVEIGEWSDVFDWVDWEDDGTFNRGSGYSLHFEPDLQFSYPSSESQMIHSNGDDIGKPEQTLKHHNGTAAFGNGDANILLNTIFPEQVENNSSLHYTTSQFGLSGDFIGPGHDQEQTETTQALEMNPRHSKRGEQKNPIMLPEIKINDSFAEHLFSTDRDYGDQPATPAAPPPRTLSSLPTQPTTIGG